MIIGKKRWLLLLFFIYEIFLLKRVCKILPCIKLSFIENLIQSFKDLDE